MNRFHVKKLFSKEWFDVWQWIIIRAVNFRDKYIREEIRDRLGIKIDRNINIYRIYPNSLSIQIDNSKEGKIIEHIFYDKEIFSDKFYKELLPIWQLIHKWDINFANRFIPKLNLGFDTLTAYPDANTGGSSCDGLISKTGSSWYNVRNAVSGDSIDMIGIAQIGSIMDSGIYEIRRLFILFDTSMLSGAELLSASLKITSFTYDASSDALSLYLVSAITANNNNLVLSDYSGVGTTSITNSEFNGFSISQNTVVERDLVSTANINKTGVTKFALRDYHDFLNTAPNNVYNLIHIYTSEYSMANTPTLKVNYLLPIIKNQMII
jgi:hypothetical protein